MSTWVGAAALWLMLAAISWGQQAPDTAKAVPDVPALPCWIADDQGNILAGFDFDTTSADPAKNTMSAVLGAKTVTAQVIWVNYRGERDRFNLKISVDGRDAVKIPHVDLPLFVELAVDGRKARITCARIPTGA